jgi:hypothetical protein
MQLLKDLTGFARALSPTSSKNKRKTQALRGDLPELNRNIIIVFRRGKMTIANVLANRQPTKCTDLTQWSAKIA